MESVRRRKRILGLFVFLFLLLSVGSSRAQIESHAPISQGPVTLNLRIGNGQSHFHRGELISVELTFSSTEYHSYTVPEDCLPYTHYTYNVPPEFVDRRIDIDAGMGMADDVGMGCHGAHWDMDLAVTPLVVSHILNERFRMDKPGKYQISVTSVRLGFPITSNSVDLEILPGDPKWEESELNRALAMLRSSVGSKEWETGCQVLRFLETEAAEMEMARHFADRPCRGYDFALISATHRSLVRAELEKGLAEPNSAITFSYLRTLAFVSLYDQHPEWYPDPNVPREGFADSWMRSKLWQLRNVVPSEEIRYARRLADALQAKSRAARALCVETLLDLGGRMFGFEVPEDLRLSAVQDVPNVLANLSEMDRGHVLSGQDWPDIKGPALLPALKQLVEGKNWLGPDGIALRRLYELAPDEARPIILGQLSQPVPQGGVATLSLLPDKELPEFDAAMLLRVQAEQGDGSLEYSAALLQRYASAAIADQVRPWFEERIGKMWCGAEANLVAYFLRIAPNEGAAMLRKAMLTDNPGCDLLPRLAPVRWSSEVQGAALAALDDSRPPVNEEALLVLQCYGLADSRESILRHFRQWHGAWVNRAQDVGNGAGGEQTRIETDYVNALGRAQAWLTTGTEWQLLRDLCVTNYCRQWTLQSMSNVGTAPTSVMFGFRDPSFSGLTEEFTLGSCPANSMDRLKEKMAQYPKGTIFQLDARDKQPHQVKRIYDQLAPWVSSHGYKLQLYRD